MDITIIMETQEIKSTIFASMKDGKHLWSTQKPYQELIAGQITND